MHTIDKKQQFIELRVEGVSLAEISEKLQVPRSTLWHWNQEEDEHIRRLQLINQDELEAGWLAEREQRIDDLHEITMHCHRRLISYFRQHANSLSPKELFLYLNLTRQELDQYRLKPLEPKTEAGAAKPKTVQNGTLSPENGTPPHPPSRSGILPLPELLPNTTIEPVLGAETVQNGTLSPENGTAPHSRSSSGILPLSENLPNPTINPDTDQSLPERPQTPTALPLSNPPIQPAPAIEMVQNGTILPENGTPQPISETLNLNPTEPPSVQTIQNGTNSVENETHPVTPPVNPPQQT